MKLGVYYEHQLPRPWTQGQELRCWTKRSTPSPRSRRSQPARDRVERPVTEPSFAVIAGGTW